MQKSEHHHLQLSVPSVCLERQPRSLLLCHMPGEMLQQLYQVFRQSTSRSGLSDMRLRFSWLLVGAPAATIGEIAKAPRKTILGTSLSIVTPTGQYFPEKLINLGTSRWAFKPELAISQPVGKRWLIDFYTGIWLFTKNDSFYPGSSVRTQDPLGSFQGHISYNIQPLMWVALDLTYYTGGSSSIDGVEMNDRQSNSRIGATLVLPVRKRHSVKFAYSTGAIIRSGADFSTFSVGWQTTFFRKHGTECSPIQLKTSCNFCPFGYPEAQEVRIDLLFLFMTF